MRELAALQSEVTAALLAGRLSDLAPAFMRGRYWGVLGFTWALALIIGPNLGMALFARSPALLWILCGVLGALAALIISLDVRPHVARHHAPDAAEQLEEAQR